MSIEMIALGVTAVLMMMTLLVNYLTTIRLVRLRE